jgi:hypothetical protein
LLKPILQGNSKASALACPDVETRAEDRLGILTEHIACVRKNLSTSGLANVDLRNRPAAARRIRQRNHQIALGANPQPGRPDIHQRAA